MRIKNLIDNQNNQGMTLLEVTIAMVVLVVGILGALMVILHCVNQREVSHERDIAKNAVAGKLQEIRAYDFDSIHAQFNDVDGPGRFFQVNELMPIPMAVPPGTQGYTDVDNTNPELLEITVRVRRLSTTQAEPELVMRTMVTQWE